MRLNGDEGLGARFRVERGATVPEGRAEVLFAHDEELDLPVVLKRTHSGEARALAKLLHPHIVTVHDVLTVDDGPRAGTWLVMERVPAGSLSGRRFSPQEAARIGAQIADALTALHRKGLVHCDVKPANIVMDAEGLAKLTDFDAARRIGGVETISPELTAMLQSEPGRRPAAVGARDALRGIADPPPLWRRTRDAARRRWPALTAGAAALALAATGTAWLADRDDRPTAPPPVSTPGSPREKAGIVVSKGPSTTYGSCRKNCAFVEFRATGLKPNTKYVFRPYTDNWGAFNPGAMLTSDENGEQHTDDRFPCNATGQKVWIVAEGPDGERVVSNRFTWPAG
ncbi:serine/threonine-protein kinase [Nonomuraea angiospora]|uniref:serine/threonine-protein kinase n=1 Tax=Nonomuraea angiospora TaxID=46172 RepID=UPI00333315D6